jgi:hypothetical protein
MIVSDEFYSPEQASALAIKWCEENKGWQRICDIEGGSDHLYQTWEELPQKVKKSWGGDYRDEGKNAWEEFGVKKCKVPCGFVTGKGEFYSWQDQDKIPFGHNIMMVFKTDDLR